MAAMKQGNLKNRDLDALGRTVVKAGTTRADEIDRIISDPRLYNAVLTRIVADGTGRPRPSTRILWKPILALASVLAMISVPLLGYLRYAAVDSVALPRVLPVVYTVEPDEKPFVPPVAKAPPEVDVPRPVPAVMTRTDEKPAEPKVRPRHVEPKRPVEAAFYPIGFAANAEDAVIDGRVVRVEIPRSALFALGVDVPLENGTRPVKADLLVGSDGVPRGIRLVE